MSKWSLLKLLTAGFELGPVVSEENALTTVLQPLPWLYFVSDLRCHMSLRLPHIFTIPIFKSISANLIASNYALV